MITARISEPPDGVPLGGRVFARQRPSMELKKHANYVADSVKVTGVLRVTTIRALDGTVIQTLECRTEAMGEVRLVSIQRSSARPASRKELRLIERKVRMVTCDDSTWEVEQLAPWRWGNHTLSVANATR